MTIDSSTLDRAQQIEAEALAAYTARPYILTEVAYEKARQDAEFAELAFATRPKTVKADTAQPAPAEHVVTVRKAKSPKFVRGVPTGLTCSATTACTHTVYEREDPHCRHNDCDNGIDTCPTHIRPKALAKLAS